MKVQKNAPSRMVELASAIMEAFPVFQRTDREVYVSAWGAEPFADIESTKTFFQEFEKARGGKNLKFHCSTNGTILQDEVFSFLEHLIKNKMLTNLQVSLDGPAHIQNRNRPLAGGGPSYDRVIKFIDTVARIAGDHRFVSFCSTINLDSDTFVQDWLDCIDFFGNPDTPFFRPVLPMRMSGEDINENNLDTFVEAIERGTERIGEIVERTGVGLVDFYTGKLFGNPSCRSHNAFCYCSALNTQVGIDIDGSIYPCHGPITTPWYKPWLWIGNVEERTISYRALMNALNAMYASQFKGRCRSCPVYQYGADVVCWSCPPHNLAVSGEPCTDTIWKCIALQRTFKYFVRQADWSIKQNTTQPLIPRGTWYAGEREPLRATKAPLVYKWEYHFDPNFDNNLAIAVGKFRNCTRCQDTFDLYDGWWQFDNFRQQTKQEQCGG